MADTVTVTVVLSNPHEGKNAGDKLSLPAGDAKALVNAGIARVETKTAAKAVAKAGGHSIEGDEGGGGGAAA